MKTRLLHIGNNRIVKTEEIIGVFDIDTATVSKVTKEYLTKAEKEGKTVNEFEDLPRSFTVTDRGIYISSLSPKAIERRSKKNKIF